jgi:hypothetical protein
MNRVAVKTWVAVALAIKAGLVPVVSSNVHSIGYDRESKTLYVRFKDHFIKSRSEWTRGGLYRYLDVPEQIFQDLKNAESIGSYLHWHIKENFDYEEIV